MKKRILASVLSLSMLLPASTGFAAVSVDDIDYSLQLSQIESLMAECDAKGISYDYEMVSYNVIKMFESRLIKDINNGDSNVEYHKEVIDEICAETIANLEAYCAGTKTPREVELPDYTDMSISGDGLVSGGKPVVSIGWGHSVDIAADMEQFNGLGTGNIQIEIGPAQLVDTDVNAWTTQYGPALTTAGASVSVENESAKLIQTELDGGGNEYIGIYQSITVEPNTTYTMTFNTKGKGKMVAFVNAWEYSQGHATATVNSDTWTTKTLTYKTAADQYETKVLIFTDGVVTNGLYIDDVAVRKDGGANLLLNGDFTNTVPAYMASIIPITNALKKAEMTNNAVSLLISPHYFPGTYGDTAQLIDPETNDVYTNLYGDAGIFNKYNINHPVAKAEIESFLEKLLPYVTGYTALNNICLTNEPDFNTRAFPDYYNPLFRTYLQEVHGSDISAIENAHGKTYGSWDKISMPSKLYSEGYFGRTSEATNPLVYDWIEFNDKLHADWHVWLSGIVKEHLPQTPITAKPMHYVNNSYSSGKDYQAYYCRGVDVELLDEAWDIAGNDAYDLPESPDSYYQTMFYYDYLSSVTAKPVYNSEDHFTSDGDNTANAEYRAHVRKHFWQSAMHNISMSTIWMWPRNYSKYMSGHRPDFMEEIGSTALDITRLSDKITEILKTDRKVALFYSKSTMAYDWEHAENLFAAYKELLNAGQRVGVVSEKSLDQLSKYDIIVLPGVGYGSAEAISALEAYMDNGGRVMYYGDCMTKNEYRQSQTSTSVTGHAKATSYTSTNAIVTALSPGVTVRDTSGNSITGLDWSYYMDEYRLLVNVMNLDYGTTKNLDIYLDGKKLSGMTELISGRENIEAISAIGYEPQLLEITIAEPSEIIDIAADNATQEIIWNYTDGIYKGVKIYKLSSLGDFELVTTVTDDTSWSYTQSGTYAVKSVDDESEITDADTVYAVSNTMFTLTVTNINKSGNNVSGTVQTVNNENIPVRGVIKFEVTDTEGNIINYYYQTLTIKDNATDCFKISLPVNEKAARVKVSAIDSKTTNNNIALTITEEL